MRPVGIDEDLIREDEDDRAFLRATQDAVRKHKRLGIPVPVWRDGKAILVPADEIEIPEEDMDQG